jgi:hypothetical protein
LDAQSFRRESFGAQLGSQEYDTVMETRRANVREALRIPNRTGGQPPQTGDELPEAGTKLTVEKELDDLLRNVITEKHLLRFT